MIDKYYFPFGQELKPVKQKDRTPKKVFILGVYASAVHARWVDRNGNQIVNALAVASEPEIFWLGDNAQEIISSISIPEDLGILTTPSNKNLNGPSGKTLDESFISPLGFKRGDCWLCDLLPESRVNENQRKAIDNYYSKEVIKRYNLNEATIPNFNKVELNSPIRRSEILDELEESKAEILVLLGDLPIKWFLNYFDPRYSKLSHFGETKDSYGRIHDIVINKKIYKVIPLCHPRNAGRLGSSSSKWNSLHNHWVNSFILNQ